MADCSGGEDGGWLGVGLGGWLQTVKEKSASAMEFVKRDLAEYTCTIQSDTKTAVHAVKEGIKEENASTTTAKMKKGLGYILGGITQALTVPPDDSDDEEVMVGKDSVAVFDKAKVRLRAIQVDPGTYTNPPEGPPEKFDEWLTTFDLDSHKGHISELLVSNVEIRALYTQLVPSEVSHSLFWQRYLYKLHRLEKDEERRRQLKKRAEETKAETIGWEDDWEDMAGPSTPPKNADSPEAKSEGQVCVPEPAAQDEKDTEVENVPTVVPESASTCVNESSSVPDAQEMINKDCVTKPAPVDEPICDNKNMDVIESEEVRGSPQSPTEIVVEESSNESPKEMQKTAVTAVAKINEIAAARPDAVTRLQPTPVEVKSKVSGDMVVVGRDANTPTESCASSNSKESSSLDDDWEKDFDIEVTEEDLKMAQEAAKKISLDKVEKKLEEDDDWENWD